MKIHILSILALFLLISNTSNVSCEELQVNLWPEQVDTFTIESQELRNHLDKKNLIKMVSITPIDSENYLIANYMRIYRLNTRDLTLRQVTGGQVNSGGPTGLFFSKKRGLLYVATYGGNNITTFSVDLKNNTLIRQQEISSPVTISPENVFVSDDGKYMLVANYDGHSVTAFDLSGKEPVEIWNTKIINAHGVCIIGSKVYATGLTDRKIFELDLQTGKILRSMGGKGWDGSQGDFLWPTSIYPYSDKQLLVSDAHTGYIYIIDKDTFEVVDYFGGNGPTFEFLNMPYSAITHDNKIIILSTFQDRIIIIDKDRKKVEQVIIFPGKDWKDLKGIKRKQLTKLGTGWRKYIWKDGPVVRLYNDDFILGYAHLHHKGKGAPVFKIPNLLTLFNLNDNNFLYFLDAIQYQKSLMIFSPQTTQAYYISGDKISWLIPVTIEIDSWRIGSELHNPKQKADIKTIDKNVKSMISVLQKKRMKNGLLKVEDLQEVLFSAANRLLFTEDSNISPYTNEQFSEKFRKAFISKEGRGFYQEYKGCIKNNSCTNDKVITIAEDYFNKITKHPYIHLGEYSLVGMLTNHNLDKSF